MASQWPPKKNTAFTLSFSLYKNDGTIVANPGTYTKKVSIDGGAVADIAAAVTEEDTTYGQLSLVIAAGEMNGDRIWIYITDNTAGTVPFTCTLYTAANTQDEIGTDVAAIHTHINDIHDTDLPAVKTDTAAVKVQTDKLVFTVANKVDSNVYTWNGTAVHTPALAGVPYVDVHNWNGTAVSDPSTAGIPEVNIKNIANAAVNAATAQIGANVVNWKGSAAPAMTGDAFADTTEILTRIPDATAGAAGGLPIVAAGGLKLASTVDLTAGQEIAANITKVNGVAQTATLDTIKAETALIVADTNELQGDLTDGGRLDLLIDAIKAKTDVIATTVWDALLTTMTTVGSIGAKMAEWLTTVPAGSSAFGATDLIICNNALQLLGNTSIAAISENTKAAKLCLQYYQQTVDAVLRAYTWNCATLRSAALTAATAPEFGFSYAYDLPAYCLRVLTIEDDETIKFKVENGHLLTDESTAKISYIKRISMSEADSLLVEAISARLAGTLAFALTNSTSAAESMWKLYKDKLDEAHTIDAFEGTAPQLASDDWLNSRG